MDPLFSTVEYALGGLQLRLDTIGDNVANSNTPLYRSKRVTFEEDLAGALESGRPVPAAAPQVVGGADLPDATGNSVSLENEITDLAKTSLSRQVLVSGFNYKVALIKSAAGGGR